MTNNNRTTSWLEILIVAIIIVSFLSIIIPNFSLRIKSHRPETKSTITTLSQALKMYQEDLGDFPPDGEGNLSTVIGGPNEKLAPHPANNQNIQSAYCDGVVVRYLDGDSINDIGFPAIFTDREPISYFDFEKDQIATKSNPRHIVDTKPLDDQHPCLINRFGTRYFYNELLSENRFGKRKDPVNPDHPFYNFITFDSFQIFTRDNAINNPAHWTTNYRAPTAVYPTHRNYLCEIDHIFPTIIILLFIVGICYYFKELFLFWIGK